ncbi:hypothetical protein N8J89_16410 [Crossiella sp. CA-258035]|nr:hypothetical protein [Crossiella sp. CA-258035]WHT22582.1 hypothetical protein N8J89_16410 [Crossiella sp. CA-258035]
MSAATFEPCAADEAASAAACTASFMTTLSPVLEGEMLATLE